jgi:hypothetical protein
MRAATSERLSHSGRKRKKAGHFHPAFLFLLVMLLDPLRDRALQSRIPALLA